MAFGGVLYNEDNFIELSAICNGFSFPFVTQAEENKIYLHLKDGSLCLEDFSQKPSMRLSLEFSKGRVGYRLKQKGHEGIIKAVGKVSADMVIMDLTLGFAEDTLLLSSLGAKIIAIEENPVIFLMVQHAMERHGQDNILLKFGKSQNLLAQYSADIIYLDPMFQVARKAKEKKEIQFLQKIVEPSISGEELLELARKHAKLKTIVKRPRGSSFLAGEKPKYSVEGKAIRFDIY